MRQPYKTWQKLLLSTIMAFLITFAAGIFGFSINKMFAPIRSRTSNILAFYKKSSSNSENLIPGKDQHFPILSPSHSPTTTPFQPHSATDTPYPTITKTITPPMATSTIYFSATPTDSTLELPNSAYIQGIIGYPQTLNLSCEARSAVDLAGFYGIKIDELSFLYALPESDNPEKGFVGFANGGLGQLPPFPYGVHAKPVAKLLKEYGLIVGARKNMRFKELKREIAEGRPVMIWAITGLGSSTPVSYTAADGESITVARFEHTVIVIGYNENNVTVLDGNLIYSRSKDDFLSSWNTLGNMAIVIQE